MCKHHNTYFRSGDYQDFPTIDIVCESCETVINREFYNGTEDIEDYAFDMNWEDGVYERLNR